MPRKTVTASLFSSYKYRYAFAINPFRFVASITLANTTLEWSAISGEVKPASNMGIEKVAFADETGPSAANGFKNHPPLTTSFEDCGSSAWEIDTPLMCRYKKQHCLGLSKSSVRAYEYVIT